MRSSFTMRHKRPVQMAAGALLLAVPGSGIALAAAAPSGAAAPTVDAAPATSPLHVDLHSRHVGYGQALVATGSAGTGTAGRTVQLEFDPAGRPSWTILQRTTVRRGGAFRFRTTLHRSGRVRVVPVSAPASARVGSTAVASAGSGSTLTPAAFPLQPDAAAGRTALAPSPVAPVTVTGKLDVRPRTLGALGRPVDVQGHLLPGIPGRHVRLMARDGGHWKRVATARTGRHGGFDLRFSPQAGTESLRVSFAGDRFNTPTTAPAGSVTALHQTFVSWYDDAGDTACGFHAYYGVANLSLPCGTRVTFSNGSTTIVATVDDRGPYVGGREFDLNQNVASALGFGGIGDVWASA